MSDDTRQRVLEAAGPIFAEKGFAATTVREICAAAGVNLASVNYHFGGKETLYLETVQLAHRRKSAQVPAPAWGLDTRPEEKLRTLVHTLLSRILVAGDVDWPVHLLIREMLQPTHACQSVVEEYIRPQFERMMQVIDELRPANVSRDDRERLAFSIVGQCLYYRVARGYSSLLLPADEWERLCDIDSLTEHITNFSLAAIRQQTGRGPQGQSHSECVAEGTRRRTSRSASLSSQTTHS